MSGHLNFHFILIALVWVIGCCNGESSAASKSTKTQYRLIRRQAPQGSYGPPGHTPGTPLGPDSSSAGSSLARSSECAPQTPAGNKASVIAFYEQLFGPGHTPEGRAAAVAKYIGPVYIQHNPMTLDGPETLLKTLAGPFWQALTGYEVVRISAEDDLVWVHDRMDFGDKSYVFIDILRFECGKIVEHWDVIQPITGKEVNPRAFF